jgi:electron transfer flavoprotein beta subunit
MTHVVVVVKLVPDLVEELEIDESGKALDMMWLRQIINESDDHAIEQGMLLKERGAGELSVVAAELEGVDDVLFTAAAKGADRIIKVEGDFEEVNNHALARALLPLMQDLQPGLVLTGVQAHDDLDGSLGPLMAELLGMPYAGYVSAVNLGDEKATFRKEYPGGLVAEMELTLPGVLGIQSAEQPPRYVAVSKVRQAMKSVTIETHPAGELDPSGGLGVKRMYQPEAGQKATMLEGTEEQIADSLVEILREAGAL